MLRSFFYLKKQTMKKGKQTNKINKNKLKEEKKKKIRLRGFLLRRYVLPVTPLRVVLTIRKTTVLKLAEHY